MDYCWFCNKTRRQVAHEVKITVRRSVCRARGTPKGFHKWRHVPNEVVKVGDK